MISKKIQPIYKWLLLVVITGSVESPQASCYKCLPLIPGAARAATLRVLTASVSLPDQRVRLVNTNITLLVLEILGLRFFRSYPFYIN